MSEEGIRSAQDLWKAAEDEAGISLSEVPITVKYLWFPTPQSGGKAPTLFEVGAVNDDGSAKEIPIKPGFIAFGMFEDTDEVRVYALAKTPTDAQGKPNPPHRITLSKHAPVAGVAIMALDVFIGAVADELLALAGGDDEGDIDLDEPEDGDQGDDQEPEQEQELAPNGEGEATL